MSFSNLAFALNMDQPQTPRSHRPPRGSFHRECPAAISFAPDTDPSPNPPTPHKAGLNPEIPSPRGPSSVEPSRPLAPNTAGPSRAETTSKPQSLRRTESTCHLGHPDDSFAPEVRDSQATADVFFTEAVRGFNREVSIRNARAPTLQDEPVFLPHPSGPYPNPRRNLSVKRTGRLSNAEIQHLQKLESSGLNTPSVLPLSFKLPEEPLCTQPYCPLTRPHPAPGAYSVPCDPSGIRNVLLPEIIDAKVRIAVIEDGEPHWRNVNDLMFLETFDSADHAKTSRQAREARARIIMLEDQDDWKQYGKDLDFLVRFEEVHGRQIGFYEKQFERS